MEIDNFRPLPNYSSPIKCNCLVIKSGKQYRSEEYVMKFLGGLSDEYYVVKKQVLMMDP